MILYKTQSECRNPLHLQYLKLLKIFLFPIGSWPSHVYGESLSFVGRFLRKEFPIQTFVFLLGEINYILQNFKELSFWELGDVYIGLFFSILTLVRSCLPLFKQYDIICKFFFEQFHLIHFKHKGQYYEKVNKTVDKISHYSSLIMMAMTMGAMILFNVSPMYINYKNGVFGKNATQNITYQFSIHYIYPGFDPQKYFWLTTVVNYYCSYICSVLVCAVDLFLLFMIFQVIGHIEILKFNLYNFQKPKMQSALTLDIYNDTENVNIAKTLRNCVDHHRLIVRFTDDMSNFFGPMLAVNYLFHLISCCVLLLECSSGEPDVIVRYGPATMLVFGQLVLMSVIFEVVSSKSETLIDAVYAVPWESMNVSNQRSVCILLNRMQTPIRVKALGLTPVGVQTMAGILKTTFSYFAFLRTLNE